MATALWLVVAAVPALADAPGPTSFRTEITGVTPQVEGLEIRVLGGDSYLELSAGGHEVLLPGYERQEQYLRWLDDGTVQVNVNSQAYHLNDSRYGGTVPSGVGPQVPPDWRVVATDGTYAWHDHRIHWMGGPTTLPPNVDPTLDEPQLAYAWPEPVVMLVDGQEVEVSGELTWLPDESPVLPVAIAVLVLAGVVGLGLSRPTVAVRTAVVVGALTVAVVGVAENVGLSPGVQGQPLSLVLPGVALLAVGAAFAARDRGDAALALSALAGVPLAVWAVTHAGVLTSPVLPVGPEALARAAVAIAVGAGLGAIVVGGRAVFSAPLVLDDEPVEDV